MGASCGVGQSASWNGCKDEGGKEKEKKNGGERLEGLENI